MSITELALCALIAVTCLYAMVVLARSRMRATALRQARHDALCAIVDPTRGIVPLAHEADVGHDGVV